MEFKINLVSCINCYTMCVKSKVNKFQPRVLSYSTFSITIMCAKGMRTLETRTKCILFK